MTDREVKLPPLPRLQVPLIDCDPSLADIRTLVKWCERVARAHANAAILADREAQKAEGHEPVAEIHSDTLRWLIGDDDPRRPIGHALLYAAPPASAAAQEPLKRLHDI